MKLKSAEEIEEFERSTEATLKAIAVNYREIDLSSQACGHEVALQLCRFIPYADNLRTLNFYDCFDHSDNLLKILKALMKNDNLQDLDLELTECTFDKKCAKVIECLLKTDRISSLRLSHLNNDDYMENILEAFKKNDRKMKEFGLQFCALNSHSVDSMQTILKKGKIERKVTIKRCYGISKKGECKLPENTQNNLRHAIEISKESPKFDWEWAGRATIKACVCRTPSKFAPVKMAIDNMVQEAKDFLSTIKQRVTRKRKTAISVSKDDAKMAKIDSQLKNEIDTIGSVFKKMGGNEHAEENLVSPNGPHRSPGSNVSPTYLGGNHYHGSAKNVNFEGTFRNDESDSINLVFGTYSD